MLTNHVAVCANLLCATTGKWDSREYWIEYLLIMLVLVLPYLFYIYKFENIPPS